MQIRINEEIGYQHLNIQLHIQYTLHCYLLLLLVIFKSLFLY